MDLNLRDIRAFVTVANAGNFTRAAARLHLSQPALTVQIRRLEETVGARLFDRNSRTVALTQTGRELLPLLQRSLDDMERVLRDARALGDGSSGTVRLACLPTFAASALPDLIQAFRKRVPQAQFQIRDVVASTVNALVRNEEADIGLTGGDTFDAALEVLVEGADRLVVVCPKDHALARKRRVSVSDVAASPLVLTAQGTSVRSVVDAALEQAGCAPEIACEPTYMMTAVAMVRGGLGVTILPATAREVLAERDLIAKPIDDPAFVRPIALIKKRGRTLPRVAEDFVTLIAKRMK
ncbi:LysR family transcriptional regulator [Paraburkholderia caribensis]|jgi:DNA-binding transcriptional LysR family regulator|uniref:LysR family transcriptional regulator n=1 Tax=Paraburkholderia caribensis TaxID=75105 RepID=A0A9Q6SC08_9BURK|nr:LysR family transcriptional regulator [Paraburkholderia caribensis]ALP68164.1 LysR family transcriptional regulator [Paraburkholderia caribensis]AMV47206.1 LysR family transcriptional regulator [Paraburkholderia caribensis]AUT56381.1 LysR family transcriptional regulator [Paraburkholderia caribensis]MCO4876699.1 LysR family transcriptional regulator [Paraburkholderia caribensis]MDR6385415.1 DNA-binding transcriptional LysR family regulator [Paraburkholderia caribensis]